MAGKTRAFILFLLLFVNTIIFTSLDCRSVKVDPAKVTISMPEGYPEEDIYYKIRVTNAYSYDIQASARVIKPWNLVENFSVIPDLSWVRLLSETIDVPASSSEVFELVIDVPDEEKPLHYNESWEVWILVTPRGIIEEGGGQVGTKIQTQTAVRVLINTPLGETKLQIPQNLYLIFLGAIIGFAMLAVVFFYVNKKRRIAYRRSAMFYVKSKRSSHHRKY